MALFILSLAFSPAVFWIHYCQEGPGGGLAHDAAGIRTGNYSGFRTREKFLCLGYVRQLLWCKYWHLLGQVFDEEKGAYEQEQLKEEGVLACSLITILATNIARYLKKGTSQLFPKGNIATKFMGMCREKTGVKDAGKNLTS